ncbi:hypothetical protein BDW22DRAFT_1349359 [Trametopsis cervina]|nr:hypothetical protein BDW22DRAFT_1349359 [Trametopsis cervina]
MAIAGGMAMRLKRLALRCERPVWRSRWKSRSCGLSLQAASALDPDAISSVASDPTWRLSSTRLDRFQVQVEHSPPSNAALRLSTLSLRRASLRPPLSKWSVMDVQRFAEMRHTWLATIYALVTCPKPSICVLDIHSQGPLVFGTRSRWNEGGDGKPPGESQLDCVWYLSGGLYSLPSRTTVRSLRTCPSSKSAYGRLLSSEVYKPPDLYSAHSSPICIQGMNRFAEGYFVSHPASYRYLAHFTGTDNSSNPVSIQHARAFGIPPEHAPSRSKTPLNTLSHLS